MSLSSDDSTIVDLVSTASSYAAHMLDQQVTRFTNEVRSGQAWLIAHHPACEQQSDVCYVLSDRSWWSPYEMTIRGQTVSVWVPGCRRPCSSGHQRAAAMVVAHDLGTLAVSEDEVSVDNRWPVVKPLVTPLLVDAWGRRSYYLRRDILRATARVQPRLRCVCGRRLPRRLRTGFRYHTYLVEDRPYLKIGRTVNLRQRWRTVTDNPRPVTLLAVLCGDQEGALHARFDRWRVRGEWFRDRREIRQAFGLECERPELPLFRMAGLT